jgi:hypothetical protein
MAVYQQGSRFYGVLFDWDLAVVKSVSDDCGNQRTGTVPFMALDTLCAEFWSDLIRRVYRHDQEGYVWVLAWTFLQFDDAHTPENPAPNPYTAHWKKPILNEVRDRKVAFRSDVQDQTEVMILDIWEGEPHDFLRRMMQTYHNAALRRSSLVKAQIANAIQARQATRSFELPSSGDKYTSHQLELFLLWKNVHLAFGREFVDEASARCNMEGWDSSDDEGLNEAFTGYTDFFKPRHDVRS